MAGWVIVYEVVNTNDLKTKTTMNMHEMKGNRLFFIIFFCSSFVYFAYNQRLNC